MDLEGTILILFVIVFAESTSVYERFVENRSKEIILNGEEKPLNSRDRLQTRFHDIGTHPGSTEDVILYTSITTNEECLLKRHKTFAKPPYESCLNFTRQICGPELVLKYEKVTEDCNLQKEYCFTSYQKLKLNTDAVLCQSRKELICNQSISENTDSICESSNTAICIQKPKLVTVTLKKQPCGTDYRQKITKVCITENDSGDWTCKDLDPRRSCHDTDIVKEVRTEVLSLSVEDCSEKSQETCTPSPNCHLQDKGQFCIKDKIPIEIDLKETTCDECKNGRTKIRPVIKEQVICRDKEEMFCVNITDDIGSWKKFCRPTNEIPTSNDIEKRFQSQLPQESTPPSNDTKAVAASVLIEVGPGRWVISHDRNEIKELFSIQKENANKPT